MLLSLSLVISLVSQDISLLRGDDVFSGREERKQIAFARAKTKVARGMSAPWLQQELRHQYRAELLEFSAWLWSVWKYWEKELGNNNGEAMKYDESVVMMKYNDSQWRRVRRKTKKKKEINSHEAKIREGKDKRRWEWGRRERKQQQEMAFNFST